MYIKLLLCLFGTITNTADTVFRFLEVTSWINFIVYRDITTK